MGEKEEEVPGCVFGGVFFGTTPKNVFLVPNLFGNAESNTFKYNSAGYILKTLE